LNEPTAGIGAVNTGKIVKNGEARPVRVEGINGSIIVCPALTVSSVQPSIGALQKGTDEVIAIRAPV